MRTLRNFPYQKVLVLGLARSGKAVADLLLASNIQVTVNEQQEEMTAEIQELINKGANVVLGSHPSSVLDGIQLVIKNPGIPYSHKLIQLAKAKNIPIITDIELTNQVFPGPVIGITGSNGKTTTTRLIESMLQEDQRPLTVAGNIGIPVCEVAPTIHEENTLILELSSFQLLGIKSFKPHIAVLLNLYDAHLDYHQTVDHYIQAKSNIFKNQSTSDYLVYNADDLRVKSLAMQSQATLIPFSQKRILEEGAYVDKGILYFKKESIINRKDIVLVGDHHLENILAAIAVAKAYNVSTAAIIKTLTSFTGVKHRLQFVKNHEGRLFYNDSKATNPLATKMALDSFDQPIILLAGGLDRGDTFRDLVPSLKNIKHMVLFGQNIKHFVDICNRTNITYSKVDDVVQATYVAYQKSCRGDVILLSPASASWDQYKSFEERGDMFIQAVHKIN